MTKCIKQFINGNLSPEILNLVFSQKLETIKNTITSTTNSNGTITTSTTPGNIVYNWKNTHTAYMPNIGNQFVYPGSAPTPFHINFSWDGKTVDVTLKNGNDIFKLANAFMDWLDKNEIDYSVKTKGRKKKK